MVFKILNLEIKVFPEQESGQSCMRTRSSGSAKGGKAHSCLGAKSDPGSLCARVEERREVVRMIESNVPSIKWDEGSELKVS